MLNRYDEGMNTLERTNKEKIQDYIEEATTEKKKEE